MSTELPPLSDVTAAMTGLWVRVTASSTAGDVVSDAGTALALLVAGAGAVLFSRRRLTV